MRSGRDIARHVGIHVGSLYSRGPVVARDDAKGEALDSWTVVPDTLDSPLELARTSLGQVYS